MGQLDMCILNGDNKGYTIKGPDPGPGYKEWILFHDIVLCQSQLKQVKVYGDDQEGPLSREVTHDWLEIFWNDIAESELARRVVGCTESDFDAQLIRFWKACSMQGIL